MFLNISNVQDFYKKIKEKNIDLNEIIIDQPTDDKMILHNIQLKKHYCIMGNNILLWKIYQGLCIGGDFLNEKN
jgi:hypothetical protein